jgi:hypothetical protein
MSSQINLITTNDHSAARNAQHCSDTSREMEQKLKERETINASKTKRRLLRDAEVTRRLVGQSTIFTPCFDARPAFRQSLFESISIVIFNTVAHGSNWAIGEQS